MLEYKSARVRRTSKIVDGINSSRVCLNVGHMSCINKIDSPMSLPKTP